MKRFKLSDGTFMMVAEENIEGFLQEYKDAIEVGKTDSSTGVIPTGEPNNMGLNSGDGSSGYNGPETVGELAYDIIGFDFAEPFVEKAKAAVEFFSHIMDDYEYKTEETDRKKGQYKNIKKVFADAGFSGEYNPLVNLFAEGLSNMGRSGEGGSAQGAGTEAGFIVMNAAVDTDSDEELLQKAQGLIDVNNNNQGKEPTDNIKKYQERYEQLEEEHGGTMAWMVAVAENPMYIRDVSIQSLAMMGTALATSETIQRNAAVGTTGAAMAGSFVPGIGTGLAAISGLFGSVSGQMDASLTYQQFLQEQLTEDGKDFTAENIVALLQDDKVETYEDPNGNTMLDITGTKADIVKQRSIRRGWAVGLTDGFTGILSGGVAKGSLLKSSKLTTKTTKAIKGTATAVAGGLASEIGGQTAGGQEYDAGEILTEGFAEKGMVMTGVTVIPQLIKKRGSYTLNGEKLTEKKFVKEVNNMNDVTLAQASYKIENDGAMQNQLDLRSQNAVMESQIDAKVSDSKDRKTLVEKQKQLEKAEADAAKKGAYEVPGAELKVEKIKAEMKVIIDKYAGADGRKKTVRDRAKIKELVARAQERILLEETEKFAESGGKKLDLNPYQAFTNTDKFVKGVVDHLMKQKQYIFDGVEVDITKLSDKKIAEEVQRIEKSSRKGAGAAILTDTNGKDTIFINREAAVKYRQLNVGSHEILHKVLKGALTNMKPEAREILINEFKQEVEANLGGKALRLIEQQLDAYGSTINRKTSSEWFTALSDVIESKDNNITYDNSKGFFDSIKDKVANIFKDETEYENLSIKTGEQAFEFMKEYSQNVKKGELSERMVAFAKGQKIPPKDKKAGVSFSKDQTKSVNDLGKQIVDEDGTVTDLEKEGQGNAYFEAEAENIWKQIQKQGLLDGLILAQPHEGIDNKTFLDTTYTELFSWFKKYQPERKNPSGLFGHINPQIPNRAKQAYNAITKDEIKYTKEIGETTKEGEVKIQVAAEKSAEMEAFEEEDLSIQGQAKKAKAKEQRYSKLRQEMGFKREVLDKDGNIVEEGDKIHKEVLDNVKKSLMIAYGATQNIKDVQLRAQAIALKLKKEYANLNSPLFKQLKNFLTYGVADTKVPYGTKDIYISQLKKYREAIVESMSTADLVQMERNTPEADRIFTDFIEVLTSVEQVQDAVNKGQLPPDALNKITKDKKTGKGAYSVNLYGKTMPTPVELVSWADQPAKNPVTGLRQGLKGTRKDGITMRAVNSLITDAIMEARQSDQVQERIAEMDIDPGSVAELGAAIGREVNVKFSKSNAIGDVTAAIDGAGSVNVYSQIKFSKSHREAYEKQLTKRRPDLTETQRKGAVQSVFDFVDGKAIPNHLKSKYEKMAMHYTANGFLILPEDGYKVIEAEKIATQKKLDPFSFKNPNVLIETFVGEVKGTRTNPDNVKTFSNKTQFAGGVTVYNVEDSKQGQKDVRKVIDTHFGEKSNPWCLAARGGEGRRVGDYYNSRQEAQDQVDMMKSDPNSPYTNIQVIHHKFPKGESDRYHIFVSEGNELTDAWSNWKNYNQEGNGFKIAFHNGRLVAFRDGNNMAWWDRNDKPTDAPVIRGKKDKDGFKPVSLVYKNKSEVIHQEKVTGNKKNGTTIRKDVDGTVILQETKKNGRTDGLDIQVDNKNKKSNDYNFKRTQNFKEGQRSDFKEERTYNNSKALEEVSFGKDEIRVDNITKYERSFTEKDWTMQAETITIEGTINQKYFKEFQDPSSVTGWEKTNLQYILPTYERYYGIQGKKVKIVKTTKNEGKTDYRGKNVTVTIDGVVQEARVKFSKSGVDYNKAQNAVKFSKNLTDRQTKRKLLTTLEKLIKNQQQDSFVKSTLVELKGAAELGLDLRDVMMGNVSVSEIVDIDGVIQDVKNMKVDEIRRIGHSAFVKLLDTADTKEVLSFAKNVFRSTRSAGVFDITTNKLLISEVLDVISNGKFKDQFTLEETSEGSGKFRLLHDGKKVELYEDVTNIKKNARKDKALVNTVNEQAVQARAFILDILGNKDISKGDRIAMLQLMAYDQRGALRKASKMGITLNENIKTPVSELTLEHEVTIDDMIDNLIDFINEKPGAIEKVNDMFENSYVHVLPKSIDSVLSSVVENGVSYKNKGGMNRYTHPKVLEYLQKLESKNIITLPARLKFSKSNNSKTLGNAINFSRSANNPTKGITVLDFDDTLATSKSLIRFTRPDGTKGTLNAEQYASTYQELTELGYQWDFSEFTKVVDGKTAPLFNKAMKLQGKFGPESMFVLTARPSESAGAIHAFLKANGLNIPLKNITGLANSTAEAKALWMAEKVGEGYNDFYFADDALQNVKAVKNMLNQLDVKSKVQQARVKFSKSMDPAFNEMLERTTGVPAAETISQARATKRGGKKGRFELFVPPSAEDFLGLLYKFAGKGEQGNADLAFLKQSLIDPLNRAYTELNETKQAIADDYRNLKKQDPETAKKLRKQSPDADFTYGDAVRVYLWNKSGIEVPGLSESDQNTLAEMVTSDPKLQQFADQLGLISRQEDGYVAPGEYWQVGDIRNDLDDATSKIGRKQFFTEFIENADIIFSQENLQKIEAIYGSNFREALENILYRTKTGSNKSTGSTRLESGFIKWINGSVAATMFVNTRSALLQTLSSVNFTNWGDNNPYKMAKAFANQTQFWSDFSMLFNSAKLKQRRSGLGMDINANELTTYMAKSKSSPKALLNWLLQKGFLPTQMADSFAISIGGASFYRNRVNTYLKQGMDAKKAEAQAFNDFSEIAEATQQSARPDMVSQQQASPLGKFILNFQNTPMQYTRLIKKATIDLIKGRGDIKTNISRIVYYGAVQNMIFYGLQTALFAMMFSDDEEDEEFFQKKKERVANGMVDSLLRGTGIGGAAIATAKNMIIKFLEQKEKGYNKDESAVLVQFLNFSPVVGIKAQKIVSATKGYNYNEKVIDHMDTFDINNPVWSSVTSVVEGTTNIPLNRLHKKVSNVRAGLDAENEAWQRLSTLLGFSTWDVGIENREIDAIKAELKEMNKGKKKKSKSTIMRGGSTTY